RPAECARIDNDCRWLCLGRAYGNTRPRQPGFRGVFRLSDLGLGLSRSGPSEPSWGPSRYSTSSFDKRAPPSRAVGRIAELSVSEPHRMREAETDPTDISVKRPKERRSVPPAGAPLAEPGAPAAINPPEPVIRPESVTEPISIVGSGGIARQH